MVEIDRKKQLSVTENKYFWAMMLAVLVAAAASLGFFVSSIDGFGGEYTVFISDFYTQYSAFAKYFAESSLLEKIYSFSKGFGEQSVGLNAYYTLSPLNYLLLLFSEENISFAFCLIIILRFIFIAESMYRYLSTHYKNYFWNIVFSLAWALYPNIIRNHYNVLWLEAIGFLPLLIMGTERVVDGKGKKFFIGVYFLSLLSNYYITAMSSVYIFFYFFYYRITKLGDDFKRVIKKVFDMAESVIMAVMLASPVLLPAFIGLISGKFNDSAVSDWRQIKHRKLNDFAFMLFEQFYIIDNKPQLIGCVAMLFVLISFFINKNIVLKQRILAFVLLFANTLAGLAFRRYSYLWTAFSNPIGHYFRQIFLYVFTITILARMSFEVIDKKTAAITSAIMLLIYIFARGFYLHYDYLPWTKKTVVFTVLSVSVCLLVFLLIDKKWAKTLFALYLSFSVVCQAAFFMEKEVSSFRPLHDVTNRQYKQLISDVNYALDKVEDSAFLRVEDTDSIMENQPLLFGYNGVSYFSSDYSGFVKEMSMHFGYPDLFYGTAYSQDILRDSFFGIKYIMSYSDLGWQYELAYDGNKNLYYNRYALPLIFTADNNFVEWSDNGRRHIGNMFRDIAGISVVNRDGSVNTIALEQATSEICQNSCDVVLSDGALLKIRAKGEHVLSTIPYSDDWHIYLNGEKINRYKFMDYFLAFDINAQQACDVTMIYIPKGFVAGCRMCITAVIIGVVSLFIKKTKKNSC